MKITKSLCHEGLFPGRDLNRVTPSWSLVRTALLLCSVSQNTNRMIFCWGPLFSKAKIVDHESGISLLSGCSDWRISSEFKQNNSPRGPILMFFKGQWTGPFAIISCASSSSFLESMKHWSFRSLSLLNLQNSQVRVVTILCLYSDQQETYLEIVHLSCQIS